MACNVSCIRLIQAQKENTQREMLLLRILLLLVTLLNKKKAKKSPNACLLL